MPSKSTRGGAADRLKEQREGLRCTLFQVIVMMSAWSARSCTLSNPAPRARRQGDHGRGDVEFGVPDAVTEQDQGERGVVLPGHPSDAVQVLAVGVQAVRPAGGVR